MSDAFAIKVFIGVYFVLMIWACVAWAKLKFRMPKN